MTTEQVWTGAAGAVALVALVLALLAHRRARRAESLVATLVDRLGVLEAALTPPTAEEPDPVTARAVRGEPTYVLTHLGASMDAAPVARPIEGRLFADIVARESVVKAASWTHGLRRALSPANRNRIRFEVRQEMRRAGRDRRAETKQALREFRERERAATGRDVREDVA